MIPTRQACIKCGKRMAIDYYASLWSEVVHEKWVDSILCIDCYAEMGDERGIAWEEGLTMTPVSLVSQHRFVADLLDEQGTIDRLEDV